VRKQGSLSDGTLAVSAHFGRRVCVPSSRETRRSVCSLLGSSFRASIKEGCTICASEYSKWRESAVASTYPLITE
jgi:hypothetical protein